MAWCVKVIIPYIIIDRPVHRGRCHEASGWWSRMWRPRAEAIAASTPGRRRTPPGHTKVPREELADGLGHVGLRRKRGPDAVRRRDGAPRGARISPDAHAPQGADPKMLRRSALHPLDLFEGDEKGDYGVPGAAKNTGGGALAILRAHPDRHAPRHHAPFHLHRLRYATCSNRGAARAMRHLRGRTAIRAAARPDVDDA